MPLLFWITLFFTIPMFVIFLYSFLQKDVYGGVKFVFSLDAYKAIYNPTFMKILGTTLWISISVTILTLFVALPVSYFIARSKRKNLYLFLIIVPFWTNFLIRIYAWMAILGNNGFINNFFIKIGLFEHYFQMLYNPYAIIVISVYAYLPYAILPLYSAIEKFNFSLLDAARDLGATKSQAHIKVFLPGIRSGINTALIFTFIPSLGAYAIPQLVGGKNSMMIGNVIAREITITRNWPLASSMSVLLTAVTTIAILIVMRKNNNNNKVVIG